MGSLPLQGLSELEHFIANSAKGGSHEAQDEDERVSIAHQSRGEAKSEIHREAFQVFLNIWSQVPPEWKERFQKLTPRTVLAEEG